MNVKIMMIVTTQIARLVMNYSNLNID